MVFNKMIVIVMKHQRLLRKQFVFKKWNEINGHVQNIDEA